MGKSKRVFKPKHSLKNKKPRYNKKGGGFFGGNDEPEIPEAPAPDAPAPDAPAPAPAPEVPAPAPAPEVPAQKIETPEKECCPCNKGIADMLNPKNALQKLEGNLIGAQDTAVNTVTTKVSDATNAVKEKGRGFFSKLFGGPTSGGGRKNKRRTIRKSKSKGKSKSKSKGKRKGKGSSKKNKRITRRH